MDGKVREQLLARDLALGTSEGKSQRSLEDHGQ